MAEGGFKIAEAFIEVQAKVDKNSIDADVRRAGSGMDAHGKAMGASLTGGIKAAIAAAGIGAFFAGAFSEGNDAIKVGKQTEAVFKSMGVSAWMSAGQLDTLVSSLSDKAAIDDELIQSGANVLLTFGNIRNEVGQGNDIFDQATTLALDMSVALGTDLDRKSVV